MKKNSQSSRNFFPDLKVVVNPNLRNADQREPSRKIESMKRRLGKIDFTPVPAAVAPSKSSE